MKRTRHITEHIRLNAALIKGTAVRRSLQTHNSVHIHLSPQFHAVAAELNTN